MLKPFINSYFDLVRFVAIVTGLLLQWLFLNNKRPYERWKAFYKLIFSKYISENKIIQDVSKILGHNSGVNSVQIKTRKNFISVNVCEQFSSYSPTMCWPRFFTVLSVGTVRLPPPVYEAPTENEESRYQRIFMPVKSFATARDIWKFATIRVSIG
jgi:hypothetical protein